MNRSHFSSAIVSGALVLAAYMMPLTGAWSGAMAQNAPERPLKGATIGTSDDERIDELVLANHILARQNVVDGFGHISVRLASNPRHYFMSASVSPALVTRADILEFDEDSKPVNQRGRNLYGERFIHGEIYRARADVLSVAHSHSPEVLPFGLTRVPLKALIHTAAFLGTQPVPVYDIRSSEGPDNLMLVHTISTGADPCARAGYAVGGADARSRHDRCRSHDPRRSASRDLHAGQRAG